ncbi:hypothetical protein BEN47_00435 [Hymenobacter lapidarius]|uniref:Uncharacterized protein n=1 Tax=Hymenobacter lapidarius TaxID=1908237 RepID=A0A1G1T9X1_9BACT|nr:hypothetical protein [Hymenobacter lapidarius]OGX87670.1 hypothetical protein BEN47_00435 [Hymenobacter lapidarius]
MKNVFVIGALVLALGLIGYLYQQLSATQKALQTSEQRFSDCEKVTFQLQNQLALLQKKAASEPRNKALAYDCS